MPRYVAFLRAINVGGHIVKMDQLRKLFTQLGFTDVETFIASGNVLFTSPSKSGAALEAKIEKHLKAALGYEVATFVRTATEVCQGGARSGCRAVCPPPHERVPGGRAGAVFSGSDEGAVSRRLRLVPA